MYIFLIIPLILVLSPKKSQHRVPTPFPRQIIAPKCATISVTFRNRRHSAIGRLCRGENVRRVWTSRSCFSICYTCVALFMCTTECEITTWQRETTSKRKFRLWATFYSAPSSSQHITLSLHMTVIDECINIQLSTWWIYSCASTYVDMLYVCTPILWWMWEWHAQMWYRCACIGSLAHDISVCNGCVQLLYKTENVANARLRTKQVWCTSK